MSQPDTTHSQTVKSLHDAAMRKEQEASVLLLPNSYQTYHTRLLYAEAMMLEEQAVSLVERNPVSEPTRSILYRSAASLAMMAGQYGHMRRLATEGLRGFPSPRETEWLTWLAEGAQEGTEPA
jgi:hypothetical protein